MNGIFTTLIKAMPKLTDQVHSILLNNQSIAKAKEAINLFCQWVEQRSSVCSEFITTLINTFSLNEAICKGEECINDDADTYDVFSTLYDELIEYSTQQEGDSVSLNFTDTNGCEVIFNLTRINGITELTDSSGNLLIKAYIEDGVKKILSSQLFERVDGVVCNFADFIRGQLNSLSINEVLLQVRDLLNTGSFSLDTLKDTCEAWINKGSSSAREFYLSIRRSFTSGGIGGVISYLISYIKVILSSQSTNNVLVFTDNSKYVPLDVIAGFVGVAQAVLDVVWPIVLSALEGVAAIIAGLANVVVSIFDRVSELTLCRINDGYEYDVYPATALGYFQHEIPLSDVPSDFSLYPVFETAAEGGFCYIDVPGGLLVVGPSEDERSFRCEFHPSMSYVSDADCYTALRYEEVTEDITGGGYTYHMRGYKPTSSTVKLHPSIVYNLYELAQPLEIDYSDDGYVSSGYDNFKVLKCIIRNMCIFWTWIFTAEYEAFVNSQGFSTADMFGFGISTSYGPFSSFFNGIDCHFGGANPIIGILAPDLFMSAYNDQGVFVNYLTHYSDDWFRSLADDTILNYWSLFEKISQEYVMGFVLDRASWTVYSNASNNVKKDWQNWNSNGITGETSFLTSYGSPADFYHKLECSSRWDLFGPKHAGYGTPVSIPSWRSGLAVPMIDLPKVTNKSLTLFMTIISGIAIAASVIVPVAVRAIRIAKLRAQGKVEQAWYAFSDDPTEENLMTYRRAAFVNNFKTFLLGGTCFDTTNYWESSSWRESSVVSDGVSALGDFIQSQYESSDYESTDNPSVHQIIRLIHSEE